MENPASENENQTERNPRRPDELHLDRIVASQPEIGPTPPDGGYGWVILVSATIYYITVPGLLVMYSFIILKSLKEEDHEDKEKIRIWDVGIALVPVLAVVMRLFLESWCRTVIKLYNMPRFIALTGLCPTVAGVLLSSFNTNPDDNDHIINIFAGIFIGAGWALTSQQTDIIITHYFRDKLTIVQRLSKLAPSVGNCIVPMLVGILCISYPGDVVVMIYGAILMQNCFFLASYTRPIYIEKVIKSTYNMLKDAADDDDEIIFSHQNRNAQQTQQQSPSVPNTSSNQETVAQDDADDSIVVFNSKQNAKEIIDPAVQLREKTARVDIESRFSSDFSTMFGGQENAAADNRFSSDFGALDLENGHNAISGYQELETIDRAAQNPQPLYRETTMIASSQNSLGFAVEPDATPGTVRRTAFLKKHFITVTNMLLDVNFYLYTLLHLSTTFSTLVMGILFAPLIWQENPSLTIWNVTLLFTIVNVIAVFFIKISVVFPQSVNEKSRLCAVLCAIGAIGCFGLSVSSSKLLLVTFGVLTAFSAGATTVLRRPIYNALNEFDAAATAAAADTIVGAIIMIWSVARNYQYQTCFLTAGQFQTVAAFAYLATSFRRHRR